MDSHHTVHEAEEPDTLVGSYRLVRMIGEGGMGAVYEAVHLTEGRRAALKLLRPEFMTNRQLCARFLNEGRTLQTLHHPGIVEILEFGQLPDGMLYLAMEYIDGETLCRFRRRAGGKLSVSAVAMVGEQVARALVQAHQQAVVHRDLKPSNIMVTTDELGSQRVKVLDFGIAKAHSDLGSELTAVHTNSTALLGTPRYMSPEQCRGASDVSGQADVYALGVILYEALAGRPPFDALLVGDLLALHITTPAPPLARFSPQVPMPLQGLVNAMLAKGPSQRPTMEEALQVFESLAAGTPPSLTPSLPPSLIIRSGGGETPGLRDATHAESTFVTSRTLRAGQRPRLRWLAVGGGVSLGLGVGASLLVPLGAGPRSGQQQARPITVPPPPRAAPPPPPPSEEPAAAPAAAPPAALVPVAPQDERARPRERRRHRKESKRSQRPHRVRLHMDTKL